MARFPFFALCFVWGFMVAPSPMLCTLWLTALMWVLSVQESEAGHFGFVLCVFGYLFCLF